MHKEIVNPHSDAGQNLIGAEMLKQVQHEGIDAETSCSKYSHRKRAG
ncbi:MAG: hypothetical protein IJ756_03085 [Paludibacteraceae bacterium]|nr:hypothetical protein [Paludibacteraceae bacterium]